MAYTNLQLLRRVVGDAGRPIFDLRSGNGTLKTFLLSSPPVLGDSQAIAIGVTAQSETTHYTIDDATGVVVFGTAPTAGTDNISINYTSVLTVDADLTEALRLHDLLPGDTAETGPADELLAAAIDICDWKSREFSIAADISTDGNSIARGQIATAFAARATELRATIGTDASDLGSGIVAIPVIRTDGYNGGQDVSNVDIYASGVNLRRRFYQIGSLDRL